MKTTEKQGIADESGAKSGAVNLENVVNDSSLRVIIDAWPTLPEPIKAGILAMVCAAGGAQETAEAISQFSKGTAGSRQSRRDG